MCSTRDIKIPMPFGHIAGKFWNENGSQTPILACHGWMDNAGTWDGLIPLLNKDFPVLAIDFHGYGHSSPFPAGMGTILMNHALTLYYIIDFFKWKKVVLMGHSMGASVCMQFVGANSSLVSKLIIVDLVSSLFLEEKYQPEKTANAFKEILQCNLLLNKKRSEYKYDDIISKMVASYHGSITENSAKFLLVRGALKNENDTYSFSYSPYVKNTSVLHMSRGHVMEFAAKVDCPLLFLKSRTSQIYVSKDAFEQVINIYKKLGEKFVLKLFDGTHHFHLNTPEIISECVNAFLSGDALCSDNYNSWLENI